MSKPTQNTPQSAAKTPQPPKRRWLRWLRRALLALLILFVALRIALVFALPPILRRVAGQYNIACAYERMDMYLLSGDVGFWHFSASPAEGGEPFVQVGYLRAHVSPLHLLRGRLVVRRVEAEGVDLLLERDAEGRFPLLGRVATQPKEHAPLPPAAKEDTGEVQLASPVQVDAFRLQQIRARIRDHAATPPFETTVALDLMLTDLGSDSRPTRFSMNVHASSLMDSFRLEGEGAFRDDSLDASLHVRGQGMRFRPIAAYLEPLGLHVVSEALAVRADVQVQASPTANRSALRGKVRVYDAALSADGREEIALDEMSLEADLLAPGDVQIGRMAVKGVRCSATRLPEGFRVAGIEFRATDRPAPPTAASADSKEPAPPAASAPPRDAEALRLRLGELTFENVKAALRDEAVTPAADLAAEVERLTVKNVVLDPRHPDAKVELSGRFLVPGLAEAIRLAGTATPFADPMAAELAVYAEGVRPEALGPYLDALGLESRHRNATLACTLHAAVSRSPEGAVSADARIAEFRFADDEDLLSLDEVSLSSLHMSPEGDRIKVESVAVVGPHLQTRRESDGALSALGFRLRPRGDVNGGSDGDAPPPDDASPADSPALPVIEVGRFSWTGVRLGFEDHAVSPPADLRLSDLGVEITGMVLDPALKAEDAAPANLRLWLSAPGAIGSLRVNGTLKPSLSGVLADLEAEGEQITASALGPYLNAAGIETAFKDGAFRARSRLALSQSDERMTASLSVEDLRLEDGGIEWLGVDGIAVSELLLQPGEITVGGIEIQRPRAVVSRTAEGAILAAGLRLTGNGAPKPDPPEPEEPPIVALRHLAVEDATLDWSDLAVAPAVATSLGLDLNVGGLVLGRQAEPASIEMLVRASGALDALRVAGSLALAPGAPEARFDLSASGLRAGPLAPYLPPGMSADLQDGRLQASFDLAAAPAEEGGHKALLLVSDFDFADGESTPLLKMDSLRLTASRVDPAHIVAIDDFSLLGLETDVRRADDGATHCLGMRFAAAPGSSDELAATDDNPAEESPAPEQAPETGQPGALPLITLGNLNLHVRRIGYADATRPGSVPVDLADFWIRNVEPVRLLGDDPDSCPPAEIEIAGRLSPLVEAFQLGVQVDAFGSQPNFGLDVVASGIRGEGMMALAPDTEAWLDGAGLTDGRFRARIEAELDMDRRGPLDFDLARGFGMDLRLSGIEFRNGEEGAILAGLEEVHGHGIRIVPSAGLVHLRSLEVLKPIARVERDGEGLHVLGCIVKTPPPDPETDADALEPPKDAAAIAVEDPSSPPNGEVRIDTLVVSGLDFRFEDRSFEPALVAPLTGVEFEARNLSSLAAVEDRAMRWSLQLVAGKVPVPKRRPARDLAGLLSGAAGILEGRQAEPVAELEERDLFSVITSSGSLSLHPHLDGWVKASVNAFELTALRGPAQQSDVTLGGGVLDAVLDVQFRGADALDLDSRFTFVDLVMSERAGGPISRYLELPAPLSVVIAALRDQDGAIAVPLRVKVREGGVSLRQIGRAASTAFLDVVTAALAAAPLRAAGTVTGLVPFVGRGERAPQVETVVLPFAPADASLDAANAARLRELRQRLVKEKNLTVVVQHELGAQDIARARLRANPSLADSRDLVRQLRQRKAALLTARAQSAAEIRGALATQTEENVSARIERLRGISRELAETEDALDRVLALFRPGADRQAERRTRAACLEIGQARLNAVQEILMAADIADPSQRLRVSRAQFAPAEGEDAGRVVLTITSTK